jgi:glutamine synthetase type III
MSPISITIKETMTSTQDVAEAVVEPQVDHSEHEIKKSDKDENLANMRDIIRASKDLIARQNQELEEMRAAKQASQMKHIPQEQEEDYFNGLDEEDALEVKKAKEIFPKAVNNAVKKALEAKDRKDREAQQKQLDIIQAAKKRYDDFDEVMAQENVDSIITKVPAVHQVVSQSSDPIEAAYQLIKNSAAYERKKQSKVPNNMVEKAKLEENQRKPKSPNALPQSQNVVASIDATAGNFGRLTKQQQKELWTDHNKRLGRR